MKAILSRRAPVAVAALALGASLTMVTAAEAARPRCFGKRATIVGTNRSDRLRGTPGNDVIVAKGGGDIVVGRGGDDRICAGRGSDFVRAGGGADRVSAGRGSDFVRAGGGADRIFLEGGGDEAALGGGGDDVIDLGPGFFQFASGGGGDDEIIGFAPEPGGFSFDFVGYENAPGPVMVDLTAGQATGQGTDTLVSIDGAFGSEHDDTIAGTGASNFLFGGPGNDRIEGRGNAGSLDDPPDNAGALEGFEFDFIGGDGELGGRPPGDDMVIGAPGLTVVSFEESPDPVTVDLQLGTATGEGDDQLTNVNVVVGSIFDDTLAGDQQGNGFDGLAGDDTIDGRGGEDVAIFFDRRQLEVDLAAGTAAYLSRIFSDVGVAEIESSATLTDIENVWGSQFRDEITGDDGPNDLYGFERADVISGLAGDDLLDGDGGSDTLDGGDGNDTCISGENNSGCETEQQQAAAARRFVPHLDWSGLSRTIGRR